MVVERACVSVGVAGATSCGVCAPALVALACRSLQRSRALRPPLLPSSRRAIAAPVLQALHPLLINCGYLHLLLLLLPSFYHF